MITNTVTTTKENIIKELQKESKELKKKTTFWSVSSLPFKLAFRLVTWPFRALLSLTIIPGAYASVHRINTKDYGERGNVMDITQNFKSNGLLQGNLGRKFEFQQIKYKVSRNNRCSMIFAYNKTQQSTNINEKNLVIHFEGCMGTPQWTIRNLRDIDEAGKSVKINNDILVVNWPKGAKTSEELVNAGLEALLRARQAGYKAENITISGYSLGGAVAAEVLKKAKKYLREDEKFRAYINHRSFTNLGEVIANHITSSKLNWLFSALINGLLNFLGLNLDAKSAVRSVLPVEKMTFYYTPQDEIIKEKSLIAIAVKEDISITGSIKNEVKIDGGNNHSDFYKIPKPGKETAETKISAEQESNKNEVKNPRTLTTHRFYRSKETKKPEEISL